MSTATSTGSPSPNPLRHSYSYHPTTPDAANRKPLITSTNSSELNYSNNGGSKGCAAAAATSRRASLDHKENGLTVRARSPSCVAKGAKNFMAPTISASSKIIVSTPKRKILGDKNEILRSSIDSDVLVKHTVDLSPQVPRDSLGKGRDAPSFSAGGGQEIKNQNDAEEISSPQQQSITALDADPSVVPPYDPNTNYLSPRPRFLHYRPSRRIEQLLDDEAELLLDMGDASRPEDSLSSESCEESAGHVEEEQSSELEKSFEDVISSPGEVEVDGSADESLALESEPVKKSGDVEGRRRSKLVVPLFAFLVIVGLCGFFYSSSVLNTQVADLVADIHAGDYLASVHVKEVAGRLKQWSSSTFASYVDSATSRNKKFGPLFVANLTVVMIEQTETIGFSCSDKIIQGYEQYAEDIEREQPTEENSQDETFPMPELREVIEVPSNEIDVIQDIGNVIPESHSEGDEAMEHMNVDQQDCVIEILDQGEAVQGSGAENHVTSSSNLAQDIPTEPEVIEALEDSSNVNNFEEAQISDDGNGLSQPDDSKHSDNSVDGDLGSSEFAYYDSRGKPSLALTLGATIALLLLPVAYFAYRSMNKRQAHVESNTIVATGPQEEAQQKEAGPMSISGSSESYGLRRGSPFENSPVVEDVNSGPSEFISSLQHSSSAGRNTQEDSFSQERSRTTRRDSTVSSSSVSYGSFTTYEKRSATKKGGVKEEEGLTPVRRSSRIRNQVTSP